MFSDTFRSYVQEHQFKRIPGTKEHEQGLFGPVMPDEVAEEAFTTSNDRLLGKLEGFYYHDYSGVAPFSGLLHDSAGMMLAGFLGFQSRLRCLPSLLLATSVAFVPEAVNWSNGYLESGQVPLQLGMDVGQVVMSYVFGKSVGFILDTRRNENNPINYGDSQGGREWWKLTGRRK